MEELALGPAGILHADHHLRQQVLEHARRCEVIGGTDLAQVGHHRVAGLRTVDGEAGDHRLRVGKQVVADPGHRQVGQDRFVRGQPVELDAALRRGDQRTVRLAHALRLAGGARRVEHDRDVAAGALANLGVEETGVGAVELAADLDQPVVAGHVLVVAQPAWVVVVDVRQRRYLFPGLAHLVDLLLVLDQRIDDLRVVEHEGDVRGRGVLVHRHGDAAQRLRGAHRPVQPGPVVADDRQVHAAIEALRRQPAGERAHFVGDLGPRPGLPDAEVLLARGRMGRPHFRVAQQVPRKRALAFLHPLLHPLPRFLGRLQGKLPKRACCSALTSALDCRCPTGYSLPAPYLMFYGPKQQPSSASARLDGAPTCGDPSCIAGRVPCGDSSAR